MRSSFAFLLSSLSWVAVAFFALSVHAQDDDFPEIYNTQDTKDAPPTSPEQALKLLQLPPGFQATLFAGEPAVQQPIAITLDDRGRLWVAENYTYAESKIGFENKLRDRIVILEDTDHDGIHDKRTVFWDKGQKLTSIALGFGGVWALCAPQMIFIPDADQDDVPDGEPIVLLDGWNDNSVRHNIVNGLAWGPDGWLYGRHGIQATSFVGPPGSLDTQRTALNCCIWRFHPQQRTFEVVAQGGTNSWGHDFDENGQLFFINTVIGHLWHAPYGSHFQRMYGADFLPHLYGLIQQTADHYHWDNRKGWSDPNGGRGAAEAFGGGHAHVGLMIYQGDNWPAEYRGRIFTTNMHGLRVNSDRLERQGNGYVGKHADDFLKTTDVWFRGIEMISGPDGGVYLADWSDIGECHENDGVHRETGRVYKITYGPQPKQEIADVAKLNTAELIKLLGHSNEWYSRTARRNLQERAVAGKIGKEVSEELKKSFATNAGRTRQQLRVLWGLMAINATDTEFLQTLLKEKNEHLRVWGIRQLVAQGSLSKETQQQFVQLATSDPSGLVRLELASALQRLPYAECWAIVQRLAMHAEDANDRTQPLMLWYGIEPAVAENPAQALALLADARIPLLREYLARRLTILIESRPEVVEALLKLVAESKDPALAKNVLSGMNDALRGWRKAPAPRQWSQVSAELEKQPELATLVRDLGIVFGDGRGIEQVRKLAGDNNADVQARREAVLALADARAPDLYPQLKNWLNDRVLEVAAVKALAKYDEAEIPTLLVNRYSRLQAASREEAINTLTGRPASALALLKAIEDKKIPQPAITPFHARQMLSLGNSDIEQRLRDVWGDIRKSDADRLALIKEFKTALTAERLQSANLAHGRQLFAKHCASCHILYGEGKQIGPDLTGSNRFNLDYLLENMVDPSALVPVNFRMQVIALKDGRVINGVIVGQDEKTLTVQTQQEKVVIDQAEVEQQKQTSLSLMPDGLLKTLSADDARDLLAYLMGRSQVPLAAETSVNR